MNLISVLISSKQDFHISEGDWVWLVSGITHLDISPQSQIRISSFPRLSVERRPLCSFWCPQTKEGQWQCGPWLTVELLGGIRPETSAEKDPAQFPVTLSHHFVGQSLQELVVTKERDKTWKRDLGRHTARPGSPVHSPKVPALSSCLSSDGFLPLSPSIHKTRPGLQAPCAWHISTFIYIFFAILCTWTNGIFLC